MSEDVPTLSDLYYQARAEYPADPAAVHARYHELMVEHGHLIERQAGDDGALPCGWKPGALQ